MTGSAATSIHGRGQAKAVLIRLSPALVLAWSVLLLPVEVRLSALGLNLYAYRLVILPMLAIVVMRYVRGEVRFSFCDMLAVLTALSLVPSFLHHFGLANGLVRSGSLILDLAGAYFLGRVSIRSAQDLRYFLLLILPAFALTAAFMLIESVSRQLFVRPFYISVFGSAVQYAEGGAAGSVELRNELRLTLLRAYSSFSHPILGGSILISMFPLFALAGIKGWPRFAGMAAGLCSFFSLSSAAIIGIGMATALPAIDALKRRVLAFTWYQVTFLLTLALLAAQVLTKNGIIAVISRFTINPQTASVRRLQWEYGLAAIERRPWFGYAYETIPIPDWLTSSIDAHFLALGIRNGVVTPLLLLVLSIAVIVLAGRRAAHSARDRGAHVGYCFSMVVLIFVGMTVTYFAEANIWYMLVIGIGAGLASGAVQRDSTGATITPPAVGPAGTAALAG